jgi:branched-chain amino acid transport system ATP-binding protein
MSATFLLEVNELSVRYGKVEGLHQASLRVSAGSIVTVIGPNGAGKTTMLKAIIGLLPSRGEIRYRGHPLMDEEVEARVEQGLTLVTENRELFAMMTVQDNLILGAFSQRRRGRRAISRDIEDVYQRFPRLCERRDQLAATLSGGERQMLALGRALMSRPKLLMLDEPSLGLAPKIVREILRMIAELKKRGISLLLVEQNARAALQIADYGYVLENGTIVLEGRTDELAQNPRVIESYLGFSGKIR